MISDQIRVNALRTHEFHMGHLNMNIHKFFMPPYESNCYYLKFPTPKTRNPIIPPAAAQAIKP